MILEIDINDTKKVNYNKMIPFNQPLSKKTLDIVDKTRSNIFAWNGQFSPQLIESLLKNYSKNDSVILDPFSGSGTVLYESACLQMEAYGIELNPSAWTFSRFYELCFEEDREEAVKRIRHKLETVLQINIFDPTPTICDSDFNDLMGTLYFEANKSDKIILDVFIILLDLYNYELTKDRVFQVFERIAKKVDELPVSTNKIQAMLGDARKLSLPNQSIDFVITSPPYINVFNYHQNYRMSAEKLGWDILKVARSEIGSNRANRGNRFYTVVQYCLDMAQTFQELLRVCKADAKLIFVVGRESNVLGVSFKNSAMLTRIAKESNCFDIIQSQERKFTNRFGLQIFEDIIHMTPENDAMKFHNFEMAARIVAKEALESGLLSVKPENRCYLQDAIDKVFEIKSTPIYSPESPSFKAVKSPIISIK